jgi:uncharacterized OB-fold protein
MIFYPRPLCPYCWSTELSWEEASGRGKIISFSLVHRPNDPAFFAEAPIVMAEISLAEKVAMIERIITYGSAALRCRTEVGLVGPDKALRYPLPTFRILET